MRRAVIVLFMVMLPIQWVWAAAAQTCQHEPGAAVAHFGHHAHTHEASPGQPDAVEVPVTQGGDHADCGVCHLSAAKACTTHAYPVDTESALPVRGALTLHYDSHIPAGLERPDRPAAP